jgi:hypothetical protein
MSEDSQLVGSVERFLNEQAADLQVFRIILVGFLARLFGANPMVAEERLQEMKNATMDTIGRIVPDPANPGTERLKQMTAMRAEKFFLELEEVFLAARNRTGEAGKN